MMEPAVGPTILSRRASQREYLHRENINGLRNQATALKMKAAATSSSLSGTRPYRFSAGTSYAAPTTASRMLNCGTCRMAALQSKSFAPLITGWSVLRRAIHSTSADLRKFDSYW